MTDSSERRQRLREHPRDRFSDKERLIDLDEALRQLRNEPHEPVDGHRQITIAHREGFSLILFDFEKGATIPEHQVQGEVTIQVLDGKLQIATSKNEHKVGSGEVLILKPEVTHDVRAIEDTSMFMTVSLANTS